MQKHKIIHHYYQPILENIEADALQQPMFRLESKTATVSEIWAKNPELKEFLSNAKLNNNCYHILWIPVHNDFVTIFSEKLEENRVFRKSLKIYTEPTNEAHITYLWFEYLKWLALLNSKDTLRMYDVHKKLALFLSIYNDYYLSQKHIKCIKENLFSLNPFINYWYNCRELSSFLNLPKDFIFLPLIKGNKFLTEIKNINSILEIKKQL